MEIPFNDFTSNMFTANNAIAISALGPGKSIGTMPVSSAQVVGLYETSIYQETTLTLLE